MTNQYYPSHSKKINVDSLPRAVVLTCSVFGLSYAAARMGGFLVLRPEMIWPLWPGCAFLVAVLLLTPRKIWPALLIAGLAGFTLYDLQEHLDFRMIGLLLAADSIEILIAALGVNLIFGTTPRLNSIPSLLKYSLFAVVLASVGAASIVATALRQASWQIAVLTEALALLTLTPAILGWVDAIVTRVKKPKALYVEAVLMCIGLAIVSYFTFLASSSKSRPALLYSLVPFLLWAALRFGITGTSSSMLLVSISAIWGAVHRRGPFTGGLAVNDVFSLQLFLLVAGSSFMVLAAVVEERKGTGQVVQESEQRFRSVADTAPVLIWMSGTDKLCTYFNKPWLAFTGRSMAEEMGNGWTEGVHPQDLQRCMDTYVQSFDRHENFKMEYRLRHHDGEFRWVFDIGVPRFNQDGSFAGYIGSLIDVTDRKRMEVALQESEEKFRNVFRDAGVGMVIVSLEGRFLGANRTFCDLLGYTELELLEKTVESITLADDWPAFSKKLEDAVIHKNSFQWFEKRCLHKSGRIVYTQSSASVIRGRDGAPQHFVGEVLDITSRKQAEAALAGMTRKLIEAQEQERSRIGRDLHDDINQRLGLLSVELQQLEDHPSELQGRVQDLRRTTDEISSDVQALSHELHSSKMEYLGVVAGMRSWCKEFAERQKMEISFKADVAIAVPREIGVTLFRILQEALHNAAKHSGGGQLEVQLSEHQNTIHLLISDTGRGFDVEAARHGRGLGLVSMEERVRLIRGTIAIESKPSKGTVIRIVVPFPSEPVARRMAG